MILNYGIIMNSVTLEQLVHVDTMTLNRLIERLEACRKTFGGDSLICMNQPDKSLEILEVIDHEKKLYRSSFQFLWE